MLEIIENFEKYMTVMLTCVKGRITECFFRNTLTYVKTLPINVDYLSHDISSKVFKLFYIFLVLKILRML